MCSSVECLEYSKYFFLDSHLWLVGWTNWNSLRLCVRACANSNNNNNQKIAMHFNVGLTLMFVHLNPLMFTLILAQFVGSQDISLSGTNKESDISLWIDEAQVKQFFNGHYFVYVCLHCL